MLLILIIGFAGAIGSLSRYFIGKWISYEFFPFITLGINVIGCLLLGYLYSKFAISHPKVFIVFGVGFCGGFTTYSTFSLEIIKLLCVSQFAQAGLYIVSTLILGMIATFVGILIGKL